MKKIISIVCVLFALLMVFAIPATAAQAYQTYTYSIDGKPLLSPDAYTPEKVLNASSMGLDTALKNASDMVVDAAGNVYIADTDNNRILILDKYYHVKKVISTFENDQGLLDSFKQPKGVFVTEDRTVGGEDK